MKQPRRTFLANAAAATAGFTIVPRHVLGGQGHQGQILLTDHHDAIGAREQLTRQGEQVTRHRASRHR